MNMIRDHIFRVLTFKEVGFIFVELASEYLLAISFQHNSSLFIFSQLTAQ